MFTLPIINEEFVTAYLQAAGLDPQALNVSYITRVWRDSQRRLGRFDHAACMMDAAIASDDPDVFFAALDIFEWPKPEDVQRKLTAA